MCGVLLQKRRLVAEDFQRTLQPSNLCLTSRCPLLVGLGLGNAAVPELDVVLHHGSQLCVGGLLVTTQFCDLLVEGFELLSFVLHILGFHGFRDFVFV